MKRLSLLISLFLALVFLTNAQTTSHIAYSFRKGATNPTTCNPGDVFFNTATATYLFCGSLNTFVTVPGPTVATVGQGGFFPTIAPMMNGFSPSAAVIVSANNQVRCRQFILPFRATVAKITIEVTTLAAASVTTMGIYNAAGTTKLIDSGTFDSSTASIKSNTITAVSLDAGVYWFAWGSSDATVQCRTISNNTQFDGILNNVNGHSGTSNQVLSAGVLPSSLGTITTSSVQCPLSWFER